MTIPAIDTERALASFRALVRIPTVSRNDPAEVDWERFDELVARLETEYPTVHARLDRERVAGHSLVFTWKGRSSAKPTVLMAHLDVVAPGDEAEWAHPPFSADILEVAELSGLGLTTTTRPTGTADHSLADHAGSAAGMNPGKPAPVAPSSAIQLPTDQVVWGRGTLDDKGCVSAILSAVETQLDAGFEPENDVYLCFGHDEEVGGTGAQAIVALLDGRGIRPALVLDEGGAIVENVFPGVSGPIAVVGVSEKGTTNFELTVRQRGGHAATPPPVTATARLARAITKLTNSPLPAALAPTTVAMVATLGAHTSGPLHALFTRAKTFRTPLARLFAVLGPETNAMVRTTLAVTRLAGSNSDNALAEKATATINARIAVGSSVAETKRRITRIIRDDAVEISTLFSNEPSPESPPHGTAWTAISDTVNEVFPGTIVTPYITMQGTDSRYYTAISDHVYRFSPFRMTTAQRGTLHAIGENITVSAFHDGCRYYAGLIGRL
jgi:carboxypeptidase PM20D1